MATLLVDLEVQAFTLPPDERAHLAEMLLESLRDTAVADIESEWEQEVGLRVVAFDKGELQTYSAEVVFADARRMLSQEA